MLHSLLDALRKGLAAHREYERFMSMGMRHDPALRAALSETSHSRETSARAKIWPPDLSNARRCARVSVSLDDFSPRRTCYDVFNSALNWRGSSSNRQLPARWAIWKRRASMVRWVIPLVSCAILIGAAGLVKVIAPSPGPVFIAGDKPVSEELVHNKLGAEGWTDVRTLHEGQYILATGVRSGQAQKIFVDSRTGRLRGQPDDDDDD
jgi:hypothetical protein